MSEPTGHHRRRRLLMTVGAVALLAALGAPNALADTGLGSLGQVTESVIPAPAPLPALDSTLPAVDPVTKFGETTAGTVVTGAAESLGDPVGTVEETLTPLTETVREAAGETLGSVTKPTAPITNGLGRSKALDRRANVLGETGSPGSHASPELVGGATATAAVVEPVASDVAIAGSPDSAARGPASASAVTLPSAPAHGAAGSTPEGGSAMPTSQTHAPLPDIPSGPLNALFSASASGSGGALALLLAALAAATLLAAPGLGRRLRPRLAPWPQPILQLSLERPG